MKITLWLNLPGPKNFEMTFQKLYLQEIKNGRDPRKIIVGGFSQEFIYIHDLLIIFYKKQDYINLIEKYQILNFKKIHMCLEIMRKINGQES